MENNRHQVITMSFKENKKKYKKLRWMVPFFINNHAPCSFIFVGGRNGEFFFDLTATSTSTTKRNARCGCVDWYKEELSDPWVPDYEPCPCTLVQAWIDTRFWWSVDGVMNILNEYRNEEEYHDWAWYYNTYNTTEWEYDFCK